MKNYPQIQEVLKHREPTVKGGEKLTSNIPEWSGLLINHDLLGGIIKEKGTTKSSSYLD